MTKQFWVNLPVKDAKRSKEFFTKLGFKLNTQYNAPDSFGLLLGEHNVSVMFFEEASFKGFCQNDVTISSKTTEVLLSVDAQSKEEVDELTQKAVDAGGSSSHKPSGMQGWMYGSLFCDPDGHRWNVLYMDMSKMPKG